MGQFVVGQVISSHFPFSDLTAQKRRPAVVVAVVDFDDLILCQITSKPYSSNRAIELTSPDFKTGGLPRDSYIRPDKLFTADKSVISKEHGLLSEAKLRSLKQALQELFV
ncbi:MAG: type II toxin-antitoxin system PemK/MazF family toxin [Candidatus Saccharimonadales bacterium]